MDNQDLISMWTIAFSSSTIASSPLSEQQGSATSDLATSLWITLTLTRLRILRFRLSFHKWCWTLGHSWTQFVGASIFRHDDVVELKIGSRAHNLWAQMGSLAIAKLGLIWVTIFFGWRVFLIRYDLTLCNLSSSVPLEACGDQQISFVVVDKIDIISLNERLCW